MAYSNGICYNDGTARKGKGQEVPCMNTHKKIWLAVAVFAALALLTGLPEVIRGITARGLWGVNYGRVGFPLLLLLWAGMKYRRW